MRVGLLWRAEWDSPDAHVLVTESCKLRDVRSPASAYSVLLLTLARASVLSPERS
jgi:hypothetical protein